MERSRSLTISEVNRLGHRLRATSRVSSDDLALLQRLLINHTALLQAVEAAIRSNVRGASPTGRLKTIGTIVDKLKREPTMALSRMRDIAGTRIVEEMTRQQQDVLVSEIADAIGTLGNVRILDRRADPRHGYRAVHLELQARPFHVEVQVRTQMQDQWAQIVERLGDRWGRQIRYGGNPERPTHVISGTLTRAGLWNSVQSLSRSIDQIEVMAVNESFGTAGPPEELQELRREVDELLEIIRDAPLAML